jgi:hypothetical protein
MHHVRISAFTLGIHEQDNVISSASQTPPQKTQWSRTIFLFEICISTRGNEGFMIVALLEKPRHRQWC